MVGVFPELADIPLDHSWYGNVAMNRDMIPRIFTRRRMRYAADHRGSGTVRACRAGKKAALQVLGDEPAPAARRKAA